MAAGNPARPGVGSSKNAKSTFRIAAADTRLRIVLTLQAVCQREGILVVRPPAPLQAFQDLSQPSRPSKASGRGGARNPSSLSWKGLCTRSPVGRSVIPAKAGIQVGRGARIWIPAFETVDFLRDGVLCSFVMPAKAGIQG